MSERSERTTEGDGNKPGLCVFENENVAGDVLCGKCKQICTEDPECVADQSIACDSCNIITHAWE